MKKPGCCPGFSLFGAFYVDFLTVVRYDVQVYCSDVDASDFRAGLVKVNVRGKFFGFEGKCRFR